MDEGVFDIPKDAPVTTRSGEPWARWVNLGEQAGWYVLGTRPAKPAESYDANPFWNHVFLMACEVANGNVDAVHCIGPGVLSVGGMGVTMTWGWGQQLLRECLEEKPGWFLRTMAPVIHETGVYLDAAYTLTKLCHVQRGSLFEEHELDGAIRGGSGGVNWTAGRKRTARSWVVAVSKLLREERLDMAQMSFCIKALPELMSEALKLRLLWPKNEVYDAWMFTREQQALWAVAMVLTIEDALQAEKLILAQVQTEPIDAKASLRRLMANCEGEEYSRTFTMRVLKTVARVQELFGFSLE
jgi:hypothetical protein